MPAEGQNKEPVFTRPNKGQVAVLVGTFLIAVAITVLYSQKANAESGSWVNTPDGNHTYSGVPYNVGIGLMYPRTRLDVDGEIAVRSRMTLTQDLGTSSKTWSMDNTGGNFRIFEQPSLYSGGGSIRMMIKGDGSGNIGIGTEDPRRRLDVAPEMVVNNRLTLSQDSSWSSKTWHMDNASGELRLFTQANIGSGAGTIKMKVDNSGNMCLGNCN